MKIETTTDLILHLEEEHKFYQKLQNKKAIQVLETN